MYKRQCLLNEAMCRLKLGDAAAALAACNTALELDANNVKALFRRASAHKALQSYAEAKTDLRAAIALEPANRELRELYDAVKKAESAAKAKEASLYGGMFSKVSMYDDKPSILVHTGPLPRTFFDITIDGEAAGRIEFELFAHKVPKTCLLYTSPSPRD